MRSTQRTAGRYRDSGSRRAYRSRLRERQAEQTREAILQATADYLADHSLMEFSIPAIAAAGDVSVRTVYRYFPTREGLLEALSVWFAERVSELGPTGDLMAAERLFPAFDENAAIIRAQWITPHGRELREIGRRRRLAAYAEALKDVTSDLPRKEGQRALAMIALLLSSRTWQALKDDFGMNGKESGAAAGWAIRTLVADLRSRNDEAKAKKDKAPDKGEQA